MRELNPNHPVTRAAHDQWHKIAALILRKTGITRIEFTSEEIQQFAEEGERNGFPAIVLQDKNNKLTVFMVDAEEAARLAREEGGLPV